ncbi:MAG: GNAT family N-acetyltransferase [Bacteroidales bacterium]|nr:GNAT family N-acetyltransferase [Bacteroidales bacterium]
MSLSEINSEIVPELIKISNASEIDFDAISALYISAFPSDERREIDVLKKMINHHSEMAFYVISLNEHFAGFLILWHFEKFLYVEHLAIKDDLRNNGIGKKIFALMKQIFIGTILLEVEPPLDELSKRRIGFYEGVGFRVVLKKYLQPAYAKNKKSIPMWVLSNNDRISENDLLEFITTIRLIVYEQPKEI